MIDTNNTINKILGNQSIKKDDVSLNKEEKPRTIKVFDYQIGKSDKTRDSARKALPPGKRISASGNVYWESRKNRSDMPGKKI